MFPELQSLWLTSRSSTVTFVQKTYGKLTLLYWIYSKNWMKKLKRGKEDKYSAVSKVLTDPPVCEIQGLYSHLKTQLLIQGPRQTCKALKSQVQYLRLGGVLGQEPSSQSPLSYLGSCGWENSGTSFVLTDALVSVLFCQLDTVDLPGKRCHN